MVSDSRICPHFGILQSSNRPTEETLWKKDSHPESVRSRFAKHGTYLQRARYKLTTMYNFAETKHRALEALGMDQDSYSAIVAPSLLEKLPEQLRLTITRGEDHHEWKLQQLLEMLGNEIELREEYNKNTRPTKGH